MFQFKNIDKAPADAILGLKSLFEIDKNPNKVDLSIGVYKDEDGKIPTLDVVKEAIKSISDANSNAYLPIAGDKVFRKVVKEILFEEEDLEEIKDCVVTVQSLGGSGALKIGADFLRRHYPNSKLYVSSPTWQNHVNIFKGAGFIIDSYPYYDDKKNEINFQELLNKLKLIPSNDIVLFHACCHNPTGMDLTKCQWDEVIDIIKENNLILFLDFAYQGFCEDVISDREIIKKCVKKKLNFLIANSFSKNFSLYSKRVGALSVITSNRDISSNILSQLEIDVRANYSTPPIDGARIVATVLSNKELKEKWEKEVKQMQQRISNIRKNFVEVLEKNGGGDLFKHMLFQHGMFSFTGLTPLQVDKLKNDFGIYMVRNGRICLASINDKNINYVVDSIVSVCRQ